MHKMESLLNNHTFLSVLLPLCPSFTGLEVLMCLVRFREMVKGDCQEPLEMKTEGCGKKVCQGHFTESKGDRRIIH